MQYHNSKLGAVMPKSQSEKLPNQIVGNIGMYYACYRLSLLGWNVMPTARNAKGVDIVAYNEDASRFVGIQVKSLSDSAPVPLGKSLDGVIGDFWVILNKVRGDEIAAYVLSPEQVKAQAHEGKSEDGKVSYWLPPKSYEKEEYRDAWHLIAESRVESGSNK